MRALTRAEVRSVDHRAMTEYGIPGVVLMENAGRGCAELINRDWPAGTAVICCGKGNNGGDGFVIARYLEKAGWNVRVRLIHSPDQTTGDAAVFLQSVLKAGTDVRVIRDPVDSQTEAMAIHWSHFMSELKTADLIVDALLGTGLSGEVKSPYAEVIEAINAAESLILAIDLPSGLDCNTGTPLGLCVRATRTATMVARKIGFDAPGSVAFTGPVDVVDIGLSLAQIQTLEDGTSR
jgi:NAD(P)H-hydrate epimerase